MKPSQPARNSLDTCFAKLEGDQLTIGNALFTRVWRVENGVLKATSIKENATGSEWIDAPAKTPAPYPPAHPPTETREATLRISRGVAEVNQAESLVAVLTAQGASSTLAYRFQVFPDVAGASIQLTASKPTAPAAEAAAPKHVIDTLEHFACGRLHLRLFHPEFHDASDHHNELVFDLQRLIHPSESGAKLQGNVFAIEDALTGQGLLVLKEAPLPYARPVQIPADLVLGDGWLKPISFTFLGHGVGADAWDTTGYRYITMLYHGGRTGRIAALQGYQRALRAYRSGREGQVLCNYWGDRSRDVVVHEAFYLKEADAAAGMRADVLQIDSGWHIGNVADNVKGKANFDNFWATQQDFWDVDPKRFPRGLGTVVEAAKKHGVHYGLWFAPDSADNFANWRRDADHLLNLHRAHGIDYFKIDYMEIRTRTGERNFHSFAQALVNESGGKIVIDLDITAGKRPGYFGLPQTGALFVENRYTDWLRYWPHHTLRNLWKLAAWVDPVRLRMEFLNNARNAKLYGGDPLAPATYSPDYLFATVMFSSPLAWFEAQNLPPGYAEKVAALIDAWRPHRDAIFNGTIVPIGDDPSGLGWTGFVSLAPGDVASGYVLLFRELNVHRNWSTPLPLLPDQSAPRDGELTRLAGCGEARFERGRIVADIPESKRFLFARFGV